MTDTKAQPIFISEPDSKILSATIEDQAAEIQRMKPVFEAVNAWHESAWTNGLDHEETKTNFAIMYDKLNIYKRISDKKYIRSVEEFMSCSKVRVYLPGSRYCCRFEKLFSDWASEQVLVVTTALSLGWQVEVISDA